MRVDLTCPLCGYRYPVEEESDDLGLEVAPCPLCSGQWEAWELRWSPIPVPRNREQIASWLSQLPFPVALDINATGGEGVRVRLYAPPGQIRGALSAWAAMTHQQTHWVRTNGNTSVGKIPVNVLRTSSHVPNLVIAETNADPILAIGGQILGRLPPGQSAGLRMWITGKDMALQERLRALAAYAYGSEAGVDNDSPNPWGLRLGLLRFVLLLGLLVAGVSGGAIGARLVPSGVALAGLLSGGLLVIVAALGMLDWMHWRSIPKEVLETRIKDTLLKVGFALYGDALRSPRGGSPSKGAALPSLSLLSGEGQWKDLTEAEWPGVQTATMGLPAMEIAALVTPPELGEGSGILDRTAIQDVPAPPPSRVLTGAPFKIGVSLSTGEAVGIDPDGHGMATGGSRTGKSSFVYDMLEQLVMQDGEAPGIFLVDPHLSLSDAFLQMIHELPEPQREKAIQRLRIITPDQPEVVPLNLLALPDFAWAGNAIVQIGRRIWDDYWGPRMQAALLGLFKIAHAWNQNNPNRRMGLLHVVFAAFNSEWRHQALGYLKPAERMGTLALDALLGQFAGERGRWDQGWVTEVISPVLSKVMALELSPWLFAAMHQEGFADLEAWIRERAWVVLRLPSGEMGREGARLTAGVVYNVFDAIFRRATLDGPIPYYFIIDEAQEIGSGMRLEAMLSEGAKFGARAFVLAQSLAMMRRVEGFESVVQSMLANTSTQAFFSPDPEDADTIRAALSSTVRFGNMTLDLPSLQCWLRARVQSQWQPPTLIQVSPLKQPNPADVQRVIREVIARHPLEYASPDGWQDAAVAMLSEMIPEAQRPLLDVLMERVVRQSGVLSRRVEFIETLSKGASLDEEAARAASGAGDDPLRLGWDEED